MSTPLAGFGPATPAPLPGRAAADPAAPAPETRAGRSARSGAPSAPEIQGFSRALLALLGMAGEAGHAAGASEETAGAASRNPEGSDPGPGEDPGRGTSGEGRSEESPGAGLAPPAAPPRPLPGTASDRVLGAAPGSGAAARIVAPADATGPAPDPAPVAAGEEPTGEGNGSAEAAPTEGTAPARPVTVADRDPDGIHPELQRRVERVVQRMASEYGHTVVVVEGFRSQARQDHLFAQGRTRPGPVVTWTRSSRHTQGLAVDVQVDGTWNDPVAYSRLQRVAVEEGLGTLGMKDPGHLELPLHLAGDDVRTADGGPLGNPRRGHVTRPAPLPPPPAGPRTAAAAAPTPDPAIAAGRDGHRGVARPAPVAGVARVARPARPGHAGLARSAPASPAAGRPDAAAPGSAAPTPTSNGSGEAAASPAAGGPGRGDASPGGPVASAAPAPGAGSRGDRPSPWDATRSRSAPVSTPEREGSAARAGEPTRRNAAESADGGSRSAERAEPGPRFTLGESAHPRTSSPLRAPVEAAAATAAERAVQVQEMLDTAASRPAGRVHLDLPDLDGAGTRLTLELRGRQLDATLRMEDPRVADRLRARVDELHRALERRGVEAETLRVRTVEPGSSSETLRTSSTLTASHESAGRGFPRDGRPDARDPWSGPRHDRRNDGDRPSRDPDKEQTT